MKQMNDANNEPEEPFSPRRLMPLAALALCTLLSTGVSAETIDNDDNNSIVTAMYGFVNTKYADPASYTDEDYVADLVHSIYGKQSGPNYSDDDVYVESLVESVNGTNQTNSPDFFNDEVYLNHLVEIVLK